MNEVARSSLVKPQLAATHYTISDSEYLTLKHQQVAVGGHAIHPTGIRYHDGKISQSSHGLPGYAVNHGHVPPAHLSTHTHTHHATPPLQYGNTNVRLFPPPCLLHRECVKRSTDSSLSIVVGVSSQTYGMTSSPTIRVPELREGGRFMVPWHPMRRQKKALLIIQWLPRRMH